MGQFTFNPISFSDKQQALLKPNELGDDFLNKMRGYKAGRYAKAGVATLFCCPCASYGFFLGYQTKKQADYKAERKTLERSKKALKEHLKKNRTPHTDNNNTDALIKIELNLINLVIENLSKLHTTINRLTSSSISKQALNEVHSDYEILFQTFKDEFDNLINDRKAIAACCDEKIQLTS